MIPVFYLKCVDVDFHDYFDFIVPAEKLLASRRVARMGIVI